MIFRLYKIRIKCLLKDKTLFFWSLCFPIILGTLLFAGFGNSMDLKESFQTIPVALVMEETAQGEFKQILEQVSYNEEKKLFYVTIASRDEAISLLENKKVAGIIVADAKIELIVKSSGMSQSIIKSFLDQYQQTIKIIEEISTTKPEKLTLVLDNLNKGNSFLQEVSLSGGATNALIQYFYALMGMTCLMGSYYGLKNAMQTQANLSTIGTRRSVSPTNKMYIIIVETLAAITLHFTEIVLVYLYLRFILGIPIGDHSGLFLLCCFIGCLIGISLGHFLGVVVKGNEGLKSGLLTVITLTLSFLSGLMVAGITNFIEKNIPIINRINPTTLLTDAFYCLAVYDDYERFSRNLITLTIMAVALCIVSFLVTRRERYASI